MRNIATTLLLFSIISFLAVAEESQSASASVSQSVGSDTQPSVSASTSRGYSRGWRSVSRRMRTRKAAPRRLRSTARSLFVDPKKPNFGLPYRVTNMVFLNITLDEKPLGQLRIGLFGDVVPKTVENFRALVTGEKGFGYNSTKFHRLIRGFILQGGDFTNGDGTGGHSIYNDNGKFEDENFIIPHDERTVSMANSGKNRNGAQFYISTSSSNKFLDGKHVVFGIVLGGFTNVVRRIEYYAKTNSTTNALLSDVRIVDSGEMTDFQTHDGKLPSDHEANEDGSEGPKKPVWRRNAASRSQSRSVSQRRARYGSRSRSRSVSSSAYPRRYTRGASASRSASLSRRAAASRSMAQYYGYDPAYVQQQQRLQAQHRAYSRSVARSRAASRSRSASRAYGAQRRGYYAQSKRGGRRQAVAARRPRGGRQYVRKSASREL